jgi:hypothetical protein
VATSSEVQFCVINAAATATLVAAQATGFKTRVVGLVLVNTTAQSVTLKSGAAGTAITGPLPLAALGQLVWPFNPMGYCETASATLLELSLSGATQVGGVLQYVIVG